MASLQEDFKDSSVQIKVHSVFQNAGNASLALKGVLLPFCSHEKSLPSFPNECPFVFLPSTY